MYDAAAVLKAVRPVVSARVRADAEDAMGTLAFLPEHLDLEVVRLVEEPGATRAWVACSFLLLFGVQSGSDTYEARGLLGQFVLGASGPVSSVFETRQRQALSEHEVEWAAVQRFDLGAFHRAFCEACRRELRGPGR